MSLKARISSPLEAGRSILDADHLPPHLTAALEYASKRLARKSLEITLVVVRREYQLPQPAPAAATSTPPEASIGHTPVSSAPSRAGFSSAIKQLVRTGTHPVLPSLDKARNAELQRSKTVSPAFSLSSVDTTGPRLRWPLSPTSPTMPMTPATPATTVSSTNTDSSPQSPNPFGIRLVHAEPLQHREERVLRQTIEKAERKFRIGTDWLPTALSATQSGLTADLLRRSVAQSEVLFSAPGLSLLSLDHLYTFKSALSSYSAGHEPYRLEDAVDELRRFVLANGRRRLPKSQLLRAYEWLGFEDDALAEVQRMYARAYGGSGGDCGIEVDGLSSSPVTSPEPSLRDEDDGVSGSEVETEFEAEGVIDVVEPEEQQEQQEVVVVSPPGTRTPASSQLIQKAPVLKLQTTFDKPVVAAAQDKRKMREAQITGDEKLDLRIELDEAEDDDGEEELTARPDENRRVLSFWNSTSIDGLLHADPRASQLSQRQGPMTPKGYDDISPITRGEWGFLMGGQVGRQVAVTTC